MTTLKEMEQITGKAIFDYLDREAEVPTVTKAACQGDVCVFRYDELGAATTPMPRTVVVVRSEASTNTHSLHPDGPCFWEPNASASMTDLALGKLTVPEGSRAFLSHPEHGGLSIAPGTYRVGRQREYAGEWAFVAD